MKMFAAKKAKPKHFYGPYLNISKKYPNYCFLKNMRNLS